MKYKQISLVVGCLVMLSSCGHKDNTFGDRLKEQGKQTVALGNQWKKGEDLIFSGQRLKEKGNKLILEGKELINSGEQKILEGTKMQDEANMGYRSHMESVGVASKSKPEGKKDTELN